MDYSIPDAGLKDKLWEEITDIASTETLLDLKLKMEGFWQKSHLDLIMPYIAKYYAKVEEIVNKKDRFQA